ncbi:MAG: EFR1 family ferrodoxin [Bacilli bacterium]|nr:EFR1 family ferrodoxin [Bacilli bacterium]MBN2877706.1 EFR1 family ferrodoxin [Bacilli bacterium]
MARLYLYFSGTGNTKFAVETFANKLEENPNIHSIEEELDYDTLIQSADSVLIGYPIYGSDIPIIMRDFLVMHLSAFQKKTILTLATQMLFSGDGGGLACYFLKPANVKCIASMHINLPENISDIKLFKLRTVEESQKVYEKAMRKIDRYVELVQAGKPVKTGRRFYSRALGFLMQRAYFRPFHKVMQRAWTLNEETCIACGICVKNCPVSNLELKDKLVISQDQCVLCYRCVNLCPKQSIKILGRKFPTRQYFKK